MPPAFIISTGDNFYSRECAVALAAAAVAVAATVSGAAPGGMAATVSRCNGRDQQPSAAAG